MDGAMQPAIELKHKLSQSRPVLGALLTNQVSLELIEVAINAGLDYVILDTEHNFHNGPLLADACRLGRMARFPILIRPQRIDTESVGHAIDLGPCGLLLPTVESAAQLDGVRDGIYLPPRGKRRPGGPSNRWLTDFTRESFKTQVEDHFIILPQIESRQGVERAQEIAEHEITTALAVGPFDLSMQLGTGGEIGQPKHREVLRQICKVARAAGKEPWMIGNGEQLVGDGYNFLCIAEPTLLLEQAIKTLVQKIHHVASGETNPPG